MLHLEYLLFSNTELKRHDMFLYCASWQPFFLMNFCLDFLLMQILASSDLCSKPVFSLVCLVQLKLPLCPKCPPQKNMVMISASWGLLIMSAFYKIAKVHLHYLQLKTYLVWGVGNEDQCHCPKHVWGLCSIVILIV